MADLMQQAREQFEAWATSQQLPIKRHRWGEYKVDDTETAWEVWQAALRAAPEVPARLSIPLRATGKGPNHDYIRGWNDCIDAVLAARPQGVKDGR
ncbi:MAG: hypothetical protein E2593_07080 [Stenotrophomonas sp.]|nr:hypothetical protein [Stenotrophomonas sp.]